MDYLDQIAKLCMSFDYLKTGHREKAIATALPVVRIMNEQLFDATKMTRHLVPEYKRLYLTNQDYWTVLAAKHHSHCQLSRIFVLGWNKRFGDGSDYRTLLGALVRQSKRYGNNDRQPDVLSMRALAALASLASDKIRKESRFDLIMAVPSSRDSTNNLPATVAAMVGERLHCQCSATDDISYTRTIRKLEDFSSKEDKIREIGGAMEARATAVAGRSVLLIDDMFDSGATLNETARALRSAGAADVHALALARTRRFAKEAINS